MFPTKENTPLLFSARSPMQAYLVMTAVALIGLIVGILTGTQPQLLLLGLVTPLIIAYFFANFEWAVIILLISRSALDPFTKQGIPAIFAVGLDALTIAYIIVQLLKGRSIKTDWFWWCFASWVFLQAIWVLLLPLGGLGNDLLPIQPSIREWVRVFTLLMVYLLVLQLKGKTSPEKLLAKFYWALAVPLFIGTLQLVLPAQTLGIFAATGIEAGTRIRGTLGHSAIFGYFLFMFICLTFWQVNSTANVKRRIFFIVLLFIETIFLVLTKSFTSTIVMVVFLATQIYRVRNLSILLGGVIVVGMIFAMFFSTEYGQERLSELSTIPFLNPDIDPSRTALLQGTEERSTLTWRISYWLELLKHWARSPILGYGLGTTSMVGYNAAHNDFIRALVETGIIGLFSFLGFIGIQFAHLFQLLKSTSSSDKQKSLCLILICFLLSSLVAMATDNIWANTTAFFYYFPILAIAGWDWNSNNEVAGNMQVDELKSIP